jgi:hypothetical protein
MLILGGFKYLSAGADKDAANKARLTISYALGGLILVLSAWIILVLLGGFLGINVDRFDIMAP